MFLDALEVQEHPQSDSGSIWDHSFLHHFFKKILKNCARNVGQCFQSNFAPSEAMRVLVYPKDPSRCALSNGKLRFENGCQKSINHRTIPALAARTTGRPNTSQFLKNLTSSALTPYYSYRAQEICSTSHLSIASRPAAGNTCVSMRKMRILGHKTHQNDRFSSNFWKKSGSSQIT